MECCIRCGIEETGALLSEAIAPEGVILVCNKCIKDLGYPVIHKAQDIEVLEKPSSFLEKARANSLGRTRIPSLEKKEEDVDLRKIIDQNYKKNSQSVKEKRLDLVDNFHWKVMRSRRYKCVSQEQMAKELGVPTSAIELIEKGSLPEEDYPLLRKIEAYLGIKLIKADTLDSVKESFVEDGELKIDKVSSKLLTISDIKRLLNRDAELEDVGSPAEEIEETSVNIGRTGFLSDEGELDKKPLEDMSEEEVRKMIYGE